MNFNIDKNIAIPEKKVQFPKHLEYLELARSMRHTDSILIEASKVLAEGKTPFGVAMGITKALKKYNKKVRFKKFKNGDYRLWCVCETSSFESDMDMRIALDKELQEILG